MRYSRPTRDIIIKLVSMAKNKGGLANIERTCEMFGQDMSTFGDDVIKINIEKNDNKKIIIIKRCHVSCGIFVNVNIGEPAYCIEFDSMAKNMAKYFDDIKKCADECVMNIEKDCMVDDRFEGVDDQPECIASNIQTKLKND